MKHLKIPRLALALAVAGIPFLAGCGSNNSSGTVGASSGVTCNAYGQCYQTSPGGCIPISSTIPFDGSGLAVDSYDDISGGIIPGTSSYGTMVVGAQQTVNGPAFPSVSGGSPYSVGTFTMNVQTASPGTLQPTTAIVNGQLTIGQAYQALIAAQFTGSMYNYGSPYGAYQPFYPGYSYGGTYSPYSYPSNYGTAPCVSGIALQGYLYTSPFGFSGNVYLYLNGSPQHGYMLQYQ